MVKGLELRRALRANAKLERCQLERDIKRVYHPQSYLALDLRH